MVSDKSSREAAPPEGMVRYSGNGLCEKCGARRRRAAEEGRNSNHAAWSYKPEPWTAHARCTQTDPEIFYPPPGAESAATGIAKRVCSRCPVAAPCLESALEHDEAFGIWGGLTSAERYDLKHGRRRGLR